jgi:hypothetical protein
MLPHIKDIACQDPAPSLPINKKAVPSIKEKSIPVETFGEKLPLSATGPIKKDDAAHKTKADKTGSIPKSSPITAPAKAVCAIAIPINGIFSKYSHTPIIPQEIPANKDAATALIKK